jgi:predicted nucleotidyltransferase
MNLEIFKNNEIKNLLKSNDVERLGLFGSCARGQQNNDSDIDLLVSFNNSKGLFSFIQLERKLSNALGRKVDLVTKNSVSPHLKESILNDTITVYDS